MKNKPILESYLFFFSQQTVNTSLTSHPMDTLLQEGTSKRTGGKVKRSGEAYYHSHQKYAR